MILMIDNYDSFTFNIVQYLAELDADVKVVKNDEIGIDEILKINPEKIVISPGPCTPDDAGISLEVISVMAPRIPILGVCLGHQSIAQVFGGHVIRGKRVMHGKTSQIFHAGQGVFKGLNSPFIATRYHSLVVEQSTLPECFEITAWTEDEHGVIDEIMAIKHRDLSLEGVQFHPESILSEHGHLLLNNFLQSHNRSHETRQQ